MVWCKPVLRCQTTAETFHETFYTSITSVVPFITLGDDARRPRRAPRRVQHPQPRHSSAPAAASVRPPRPAPPGGPVPGLPAASRHRPAPPRSLQAAEGERRGAGAELRGPARPGPSRRCRRHVCGQVAGPAAGRGGEAGHGHGARGRAGGRRGCTGASRESPSC